MGERFITLVLEVNDTEDAFRLIRGFQQLNPLNDVDEERIRSTLDEHIGPSFSEVIFSGVESEEDVLKFKTFIDSKYLDDMENFLFSLKNRTLNANRIWQDTYSEALSGYELSPSSISLETRSRTGKSYWDKIVLGYDSDDNYILKAAVFAKAFESAGFEVEQISTSSEYKP